jgi:hypothetical protein
MAKIKVVYWVGTTQKEATAHSYSQAMKFAGRNSNAYSPRFYGESGEPLIDMGGMLIEESEAEKSANEGRTAVAYA